VRISTQTFYQRSTNQITDKQATTSQLNVHLTEGKRVIHAADDPVAAASIQRLKQNIAVNSQYLLNIEVADAANMQEESILGSSVDIIQRTRDLLVSAGNGTYSSDNFKTIAQQLEQLKSELLGLANTKDGASEYIFAGYEVDTKPFQVNEFGTVEFYGDTGVRDLQIGAGVTTAINDSGFDIFMNLSSGNGSFLSTVGQTNTGSGVIEEGQVIDPALAANFSGEEYSVHFTEPGAGTPTQYSVYSIEKTPAATGSATVSLVGVDLNNLNIGNVNPSAVFPDPLSAVNIDFLATGTPGEFEVQINGQTSLPAIYDANVATSQNITIDGMTIEVGGVPDVGDQYQVNKYIAPTQYYENQTIEVNGLTTQVKGQPNDVDYFTLTPSSSKSIFATIQTAIDALTLPGDSDVEQAHRLTQLNMSQLELQRGLNSIVNTRSRVGSRLQTIMNQNEIGQDFKLVAQSSMSKLEDLDMAQAISDLKIQQTALEVAQTTFVQLERLNLFDLIR